MRKNHRFRLTDIVLGSVIVLLILLLFFRGSPFNQGASNYEKFISAENVTRVNVVTDVGDVFISMYEGDEIRAYLSDKEGEMLSKKYKLTVKENGGRVTIKSKRKSKLAAGFVISVELPSKQYEQLQIHAEAANINVGTVHAAGYVLNTSVGNIDVDAAQGIINADTKVGNIQLNLQTISNDIVARTEVGNIVVETNETPLALQTLSKTGIGTVEISLPNLQDGSIGTDGPLVKLTSEVGDVSLLLAIE